MTEPGLRNIRVEACYFVPKGEKPRFRLFSAIYRSMMEVSKFHFRQLLTVYGFSHIRFFVNPSPIYGVRDWDYYDDDNHFFERAFSECRPNFRTSSSRFEFPVAAVFVEGPSDCKLYSRGACVGDHGECILAPWVLAGLPGDYASSTVAHEIYHAIGIDHPRNHEHDRSVMGYARSGLRTSYLQKEHKEYLKRRR
jgi:hypothetical protein